MAAMLPFGMFDLASSADEARRFSKMENIYHRGQSLAWDGRAVLDELWDKHGGARLSERQKGAMSRVVGQIMWGELAAWKIAAQLADELEPLEAKMAATSQAHDEARHFYVLHDYLERAVGDFPRALSRSADGLIRAALTADTIEKKLLGMQLQIEAMALTIFHALREANACPILSDLLLYFEKDEARHVGLGMQLLPGRMRKLSVPARLTFSMFSFRVVGWSIGSLKQSEGDLRALGVDPRRVAALGKSKQMLVFNELFDIVPDQRSRFGQRLGSVLDGVGGFLWPDVPTSDGGASTSLRTRVDSFRRAMEEGYTMVETSLDPTEPARMPLA